jgi:transcriptional regulator with XRE-family HTH domain
MDASELLREARRRAGLTQSELARRAGIPQSVLSAYERGRRQPAAAALGRILRSAGFDLALGPRRVDAGRAGRRLRDVLSLVDRMPSRRAKRLSYPILGR